jgi:hypothetical protein
VGVVGLGGLGRLAGLVRVGLLELGGLEGLVGWRRLVVLVRHVGLRGLGVPGGLPVGLESATVRLLLLFSHGRFFGFTIRLGKGAWVEFVHSTRYCSGARSL